MGNSVGRERPLPHGAASSGSTDRLPARPGHFAAGSGSGRSRLSPGGEGSRPGSTSNLFGTREARQRERSERERERERERETPEQKAERERIRMEERRKERERSMREENVDGGYLVTQGVYTGVEDFNAQVVKSLMIERRLAPFFKGLSDWEEDWTDAQLIAAVKGLPIPEADAPIPSSETPEAKDTPNASSTNLNTLTVPIASRSRSQSYTSESSQSFTSAIPTISNPSAARLRAKTVSSTNSQPSSTSSGERTIPGNTVDGRRIEAVLYKEAMECPICFLYYPPHLNKTRCCDQEICSECFVQIKRADPHLPEHHDSSSSSPNPFSQQSLTGNTELLISEPASCPFCKEPDLGVTYNPPPFQLGLVSSKTLSSPIQTPTSLSPPNSPPTTSPLSPTSTTSRTRRANLPKDSPLVVTTDTIRPDWSQKLQSARAHAARRAAAATALHTAAFLMSNNGLSGSSSRRILRTRFHRESGSNSGPNLTVGGSNAGGSEASSENNSGSGTPTTSRRERALNEQLELNNSALQLLGIIPPHMTTSAAAASGQGRARQRVVDLEEMMIMEAIRLSLAEEEERKRREEQGEGSSGNGTGGAGGNAGTAAA